MAKDMLKTFEDQIAQSEERIRKYAQLVERASVDPETALSLSVATRALESERDHKRKMEEMREQELQVQRRVAIHSRSARIATIVVFAIAAGYVAWRVLMRH